MAAMNSSSQPADLPGRSIFLLGRSLDIGGAERQMVQLALGLKASGHAVTVGLFYRGGALEGELERGGIPIVGLGKKGRWDLVRFLNRLARALRATRPDIVYSFLGTANLVAAAVRPLVPFHRLVWSIRASDMDLSKYDRTQRLIYALECRLSRTPDLIISNSRSGVEFAAAHGFPRHRIAVVANGIDTEKFRPDRRLRASTRAEWGIAERDIAIGVLSRLDPMKGYPTFLRAAAMLAQREPRLHFVCIGEGPDEGLLKDLAADLKLTGRVLFAGLSREPVAALNALDIACSPSFTEGFSNSIAEAMACGLPSVVTDAGDSALIVGDTGRVVPRADPAALAAGLMAEANMLHANRGARARARIVENFSVGRMVERTIALMVEPEWNMAGARF